MENGKGWKGKVKDEGRKMERKGEWVKEVESGRERVEGKKKKTGEGGKEKVNRGK
jgi:hypothetical protein